MDLEVDGSQAQEPSAIRDFMIEGRKAREQCFSEGESWTRSNGKPTLRITSLHSWMQHWSIPKGRLCPHYPSKTPSQYSHIGETFPTYELCGRSQIIAYPQPHRYQAFLVLDRYVGNKLPCWSHQEVEPLFKLPSLSLASMCTLLKWARLSSSRVLIEYYAMLSAPRHCKMPHRQLNMWSLAAPWGEPFYYFYFVNKETEAKTG